MDTERLITLAIETAADAQDRQGSNDSGIDELLEETGLDRSVIERVASNVASGLARENDLGQLLLRLVGRAWMMGFELGWRARGIYNERGDGQ